MTITVITLTAAAAAALWDARTRRIPNCITFPAIILGLIINTYYFGWAGLKVSLLGLAVGLLLLIIPFALGGMGAGDVKLMAAVGALNGAGFAFYAFIYSALAGGVIAVILLIIRGQVKPVFFNLFIGLGNLAAGIRSEKGERRDLLPVDSGIRFPYGIAIMLGTIAACWMV